MDLCAPIRALIVDEDLTGTRLAPAEEIGPTEEGVQAEMVMCRIVVIDDEPLVLRATKRLLQGLGHRVRTYADGRIALELMRRERADIALVDLHMAEMDGIQVLRRLRTLDHPPAIIVMTGDGKTEVEQHVDQLCLTDRVGYLGKPFTVSELEEALVRALKDRRAH